MIEKKLKKLCTVLIKELNKNVEMQLLSTNYTQEEQKQIFSLDSLERLKKIVNKLLNLKIKNKFGCYMENLDIQWKSMMNALKYARRV